jgi:transposase
MLHISASCAFYLYSGFSDMRSGFDSLSGLIRDKMDMNALSGSVFIFVNRRRTHIKLLLWEGDGFSIYYKRLEKGTFELPAPGGEGTGSVRIDVRKLQFILQGVSLKKIAYRPRLGRTA